MSEALMSFEALLAKAREKINTGKKAAKKPAFVNAHEEAEREYAEVYVPEAYVARYWHQSCLCCGSKSTGLEGIYEQRKHPRNGSRITRRLCQVGGLDANLPRQQIVRAETVPACIECAGQLAFPVSQLPELIHAQTSQSKPEGSPSRYVAPGDLHEMSPAGA